jgi:diguanylate cyclase (GGDEF)-like protein/PAS domain S-box-containing protein
MKRLSSAIKISLALALLTTSILVVAELIGIVPSENAGLLEGRKNFSESLAIQLSAAATRDEAKLIETTLNTIVNRNADVLSAVLLSPDNRTLVSAGDHAVHWVKVPFMKSTPTHVQVPIFKLDKIWGILQVAFTPLEKKTTVLGFLDSFVGLMLFVGSCVFLVFYLFIKKVLCELDPGSVVPDRIKSAFNALAEGLLILDENQQIILANDVFAEKVNGAADKLIGRKASTLNWVVKEGRRKTDLPWQLCLSERKRQTGRPLRFKDPDDRRVRTFMVNSAPIHDAKGIIRGVLATFDDITDLEKKHEELKLTLSKLSKSREQLQDKTLELEYLATRDPLSGCLNRRAFLEKYETVFFDASETGSGLICLMADIDHFKSVNDRFGHVAGDKVIQFIAEVLRSNSRPEDLVGRYGGEEFCLILPDTEIEEGLQAAERLRNAIQNDLTARLTSTQRITISIGVAELCEEIPEPADLITRADKALYDAKKSGRNRVVRWNAARHDNDDRGPVRDTVDAAAEDADRDSRIEHAEQGGDTALLKQHVIILENELAHCKKVIGQSNGLDHLTGLPNRVLFVDRLNQAMARSKRQNQMSALIALDIDAFKRVNDALGHWAGDQLLKTVAERIVAVLRAADTVTVLGAESNHATISRLSNDEFGVLINDLTSVEPVTWIAKRIIDSITDRLVIDEHEILVTCSAGVSLYPHDGNDAETLLRNAGTACNAAKHRFGRNNVRFFSSDLNKASYRQLWLEGQLYRALKNNELALCYQPKLDLKTGKVKAMEALVRWHHPKLGVISPSDFIPTAENTGLIDDVSNWVLRNACEQTQKWIDQDFPDLRVAVNLSNVQLRDKGLVEVVFSILEETGLPNSHLELEITETTMMENFSVARDSINQMHKAGVRFAIDDFGTGYSSLSCLKVLPVDSVKIDRSFLSETFPREQDQLIIGAIVSMSHCMGLRVVAEGVETRAQLGLLRNMDCDEIQGYLLAKPMPVEAATQFLRQHKPSEISFAA